MINKIKDALGMAISSVVPLAAVYTDPVYQSIQLPCIFIIQNPHVTSDRLSMRERERVMHYCNMDVVYMPENNRDLRHMEEVAETMMQVTRFIDLDDGPVLGRDREWEIIDEKLHFQVRYDYDTIMFEIPEPMEELDLDVPVIDG